MALVALVETAWLTVDEVAERLRVSPQVVRYWLKDGRLRGLRLGDRAGWRIAPEDLAAFIEERMR